MQISIPSPNSGYGIEFSFNDRQAKWQHEYYFIIDGNKKKVNEDMFWQYTNAKTSKVIRNAIEKLFKQNVRRFIKDYNTDNMDLVAYKNDKGRFVAVATSDDGTLQLQFDETVN